MRQERVRKTRKSADNPLRREDDEAEERPEIRKDLRHWFKER